MHSLSCTTQRRVPAKASRSAVAGEKGLIHQKAHTTSYSGTKRQVPTRYSLRFMRYAKAKAKAHTRCVHVHMGYL
jgi:hypothetical protein